MSNNESVELAIFTRMDKKYHLTTASLKSIDLKDFCDAVRTLRIFEERLSISWEGIKALGECVEEVETLLELDLKASK